MKLLDPGIYYDLAAEDYHNLPYASNSKLVTLRKSPKHLKIKLDYGDDTTSDMIIGSAIHTYVLEPEKFEDEFGILPEGHGNSKKIKDAKKEMKEKYGDNLITVSQLAMFEKVKKTLNSHKKISALLDIAKYTEVSLIWDDEETTVRCKARLDLICDKGIIADLKTTKDASIRGMQSSIQKYGYYRQAAMYLDAANLLGIPARKFVFMAIEKLSPFGCGIYDLDPSYIELGRKENRQALRLWQKCQESGEWPGYNNDEVVVISPPEWMLN